MKHPILLIAFLLLPFLCVSQGITFEQGTWKEALALAKQTNKPLCLYLYTSKPNERELMFQRYQPDYLQRETVGDVYNAFFINYKMDITSKDGSDMARKYQVTNLPLMLFFNTDGILISQLRLPTMSTSYTDWARKVLLDVKSPKPITAWEAEYPKKKNDLAFVKGYLDKLSDLNLNLPFKDVLDQYFRLKLATDSMSGYDAVLFQNVSNRLLVTDDAFQYFFTNREKYHIVLADYYGGTPDFDNNGVFRSVVSNTVNVAMRLKNEALLEKAVETFRQIPYDPNARVHVEEYYLDYYQGTKELNKYFAHAKVFCEDMIKKLDSESLLIATNSFIKDLDKQLISETDSVKRKRLTNIREGQIEFEISQINSQLNEVVWYIFLTYSDEAILKEASKWSEKMVQFSPNEANHLDTHAQLLYKLGRKEEAIKFQKMAVANYKGTSASSFETTLKKMEAGEKTR